MKFFIHPHRGFVNTHFTLWSNEYNEDCWIQDLGTKEKLLLPKSNVKLNKTFSAGEHILQLFNKDNILIQEETIMVEPSIKVGGSVVLNQYILPNWIIIVMKDRSYFHNRKTGEEFYEYNIYPKNIEEVTPTILCLDIDSCMNFYSVPDFKLLLKHKSLLFYNEKCVVYIENDNIEIHNYLQIIHSITFTSYYINENNKILYVYDANEFTTINLANFTKSRFSSLKDKRFISFLKGNYVLLQDDDKELYIQNIQNKDIHSIIIDDIPFTDKITVNTLRCNKKNQKTIELGETINPCFYLKFLCENKLIFKIESFKTVWKKVSRNTKIQIPIKENFIIIYKENNRHIINLYGKEVIYSDDNILISSDGTTSDDNEIMIYDINRNTSKILSHIEIIRYNDNIFFVKRNNEYTIIYDYRGNSILEGKIEIKSAFRKTGLVKDNDKNVLYFLDKMKAVETKYTDYPIQSKIKLNNNIYFYKANKIYPLPYDIKILSEEENCILFTENDNWFILEWNNTFKKYELKSIFEDFDKSFYRNVIFTDDGQKLLCEGKNGKFYYYDIETNNLENFSFNLPIKRAFNGFQPLLSSDKFRNPKLIDPISLKEISPIYLNEYNFADIDNRYIFNNKYFLDEKKHIRYLLIEDKKLEEEIKINVQNMWFFNYMSFSHDSKYVSIVGATTSSGYLHIYDLEKRESILCCPPLENTMSYNNPLPQKFIPLKNAVWVSCFNVNNDIAFYTSVPDTFIIHEKDYKEGKAKKISNRSLLCYSPSGKYLALSIQGYTAYCKDSINYGHHQSTKVFIRKTDNINLEMGPFEDLGCSRINKIDKNNACAAAFSKDDSKLLVIGTDGTFIVRYLDLQNDSLWNIVD